LTDKYIEKLEKAIFFGEAEEEHEWNNSGIQINRLFLNFRQLIELVILKIVEFYDDHINWGQLDSF
jgi:hypothetical protein